MMNGKEKLKMALSHQEAPLLFDIGGTPTTGMHCIVVEKLREYYGLEKRPIVIVEPMQMLGGLDQDLKEVMGIQTEPLWADKGMFGFKQTDEFKEWKTPWGQEVLIPTDFNTSKDDKGNTYIYACGDINYPPAGCMPEGGLYFDATNRAPEFDEDNYNVQDNLEEFGPVSDETLDWFRKESDRLKDSPHAVIGNMGGTGLGDIALVPGLMLREPRGIRDIEEWYVSTVIRQDVLHEIFEHQTSQALENLKKLHGVLGETIQVAFVCGTDLGTQAAQFCSNETYRSLYMPYYKRVNGWIHENTTWKTFKHCCGSIFNLIPDFIESGFDILNPVQWTATNMRKEDLKKHYGKDITFWGGGIDTQNTFPNGTPDQVREQALQCCEILAKDGGFVFNTIHNVLPDVPAENVAALAEAVKIFNGER